MRSLVILLLLPLTLFPFGKSVTPGPHIKFEKLVHDYGDISKGANGECEFKFTNTGTEPLIITDARGSCGCIVPSFPKEPFKPGQSGKGKIKYDTNRIGVFTKTVTVTTNDPDQPNIVLTVKGKVHQSITAIDISPLTVEMGVIPFGESKTVEFIYKNSGPGELTWGCYGNVVKDVGWDCKIIDQSGGDIFRQESNSYSSVKGAIKVCLTNVYGNTGNFKKVITLSANTATPVELIVTGTFTVKSKADSAVVKHDQGQEIYYYKEGILESILYISKWNSKPEKRKYYKGHELVKILIFDYSGKAIREEIFENGKFKEHIYLNNPK